MADGNGAETVTFKYKFVEEYNPKYVNGAYGGIGPQGELIINFFLERQPIPKEVIHKLQPDGKLGDPVSQVPDNLKSQVIRFIETGVTMNLESAKRVLAWLQEKVYILDTREKKANG